MIEVFAKPAVGAIIETECNGKSHILIQQRNKEGEGIETGMLENNPKEFYPMHINALRKYISLYRCKF